MSINILVPVDFSPVTVAVVRRAGELAKALGAKCWLIHVAAPEPDFVGYDVGPKYIRRVAAQKLRKEHKDLLELCGRLDAAGVDVTGRLLPGDPTSKILAEARELKADWIVIGSHGHGALHHLLTGSVCEGVVKEAACPVVVVPSRLVDTKT